MKILKNILCYYNYHHKSNIELIIKRYYNFSSASYCVLFDVICTNCNKLLHRQFMEEVENLKGRLLKPKSLTDKKEYDLVKAKEKE